MDEQAKKTHALSAEEAAQWLGIDESALRSLIQARYLMSDGDQIPMSEVRAFQARNAEAGDGPAPNDVPGFDELLSILNQRTDELARRALELFVRATPQARQWDAIRARSICRAGPRPLRCNLGRY